MTIIANTNTMRKMAVGNYYTMISDFVVFKQKIIEIVDIGAMSYCCVLINYILFANDAEKMSTPLA